MYVCMCVYFINMKWMTSTTPGRPQGWGSPHSAEHKIVAVLVLRNVENIAGPAEIRNSKLLPLHPPPFQSTTKRHRQSGASRPSFFFRPWGESHTGTSESRPACLPTHYQGLVF